uniref:LOB domain-containing protein n=1 Tax=Picea sitchensis TaxID=3332 RepID=B8LQI9_PICSI|nr:unknown [Picea sitchensis]
MSDMSAKSKPETWSTSPCAGCKIQRKKCSQNCVLAPYFPQGKPHKFLLVHKVFGNGHVVKLLQDLPAEQRGDAVSSMVYEASQRFRDPVHGCAGVINDLQNKVAELQSQLASTQTQLANISMHHANLLTIFNEGSGPHFYNGSLQENEDTHTLDDDEPMELWEPLWT